MAESKWNGEVPSWVKLIAGGVVAAWVIAVSTEAVVSWSDRGANAVRLGIGGWNAQQEYQSQAEHRGEHQIHHREHAEHLAEHNLIHTRLPPQDFKDRVLVLEKRVRELERATGTR